MPNINTLHAEFILTGSAETAAQLRKGMLRHVTKILRVYYSEAFDTVMVKEKSEEEEPPTHEEIADQERESEFQGETALSRIPDLANQIVNDITMNRNEKGGPLFRGVSPQFKKFVTTFTRRRINNQIRKSYIPDWRKERAKTPHAPASAFKRTEVLVLADDRNLNEEGEFSASHEDKAKGEIFQGCQPAECEAMKNEFLATLSPLYHRIWELREEFGYEYDEIEEKLPESGLNADAIRYRFDRALASAEKWGARRGAGSR